MVIVVTRNAIFGCESFRRWAAQGLQVVRLCPDLVNPATEQDVYELLLLHGDCQ